MGLEMFLSILEYLKFGYYKGLSRPILVENTVNEFDLLSLIILSRRL